MYELFFGGDAAWFTIPAILGTAFFLLRTVMLMLGGGHHLGGLDAHDVHIGHADTGHAGHTDHPGDSSDSTYSFEILSIQSIAAFIMGFGWAGFAGLKGTHWNIPTVLAVAAACGVGMDWLLAMGLRAMHEMQATGTIPLAKAIGCEGQVYVTVPGDGGRGQVRITVDQRQRIYDATTRGEALVTGTRVRAVGANNDNTLTVVRA